MIELRAVQFRWGEEVLLKNVNCQIATGERFVLVGPSGHGKSTLLKMMAGLLEPADGAIFIQNQNLQTLDGKRRQQLLHQMGMLFQKNALFDSLTASENVAFPLRETTTLDETVITQKVAFFLEAVGLAHAHALYPDEMSGGMQKRLGIARALALDPQIVFYDDPTAGLDPITSRKIVDLICDLQKKHGSTIVAITNDMNRAYQMADRMAMVVDQGMIVTGTPQETQKHPDPRVHQFILGQLTGPLTAELA
jgi:phospholipid/cholesterol/gamma-HCH transport system ATP-binding protein